MGQITWKEQLRGLFCLTEFLCMSLSSQKLHVTMVLMLLFVVALLKVLLLILLAKKAQSMFLAGVDKLDKTTENKHICLTRPRRFVTFYIGALEIFLLTYLLT